jgi:hypothetical protein
MARRSVHRGFVSRAQWRWAWATRQRFARKWSHRTPGPKKVRYRRLPARTGVRRRV